MKIYRRILVPIDFSENSLAALEIAEVLARNNQATIYLLHVVETESIRTKIGQEELRHAEQRLRKLVYWNLNYSGNIVQIVTSGVPHEEIIRYAENQEIDVIIMTPHGQGDSSGMMGNVAQELRRQSAFAVLMVEPSQSSDATVRRNLWAGRAESSPDIELMVLTENES